jgi:hypothetical protein
VDCVVHGVTVGRINIGGIVVHMLLQWEGTILGELWCTWCYSGREQYWGDCGAHRVTVGRSNIVGIVVHMILLWELAILVELWCTPCYCGR